MNAIPKLAAAVAVAALALAPPAARAETTLKEAKAAVAAMQKKDPGLKAFMGKAAGYAIFPNIAKGGLIVGGAGGSGYVFEQGTAVGKTSMAQASIGAQVGGQAYYELICFETAEALADFKKGEWTMAAQVSAVALKSGASANAKYAHGVAVFTLTKAGAMAEASVGGQKFGYEPLDAKKK